MKSSSPHLCLGPLMNNLKYYLEFHLSGKILLSLILFWCI